MMQSMIEPEQQRGEQPPFRIEHHSRYSQYSGVYTVSRLVFTACPECAGQVKVHDYCEKCTDLAYTWARERHLLRGFLRFQPFSYVLRIDKTRSLKKSRGRHFYHEVNHSRDFEAHRVSVVIYWTNPETGRYEVFPACGGGKSYDQARWFNNMAEATEWLGRIVGNNVRDWWK